MARHHILRDIAANGLDPKTKYSGTKNGKLAAHAPVHQESAVAEKPVEKPVEKKPVAPKPAPKPAPAKKPEPVKPADEKPATEPEKTDEKKDDEKKDEVTQ